MLSQTMFSLTHRAKPSVTAVLLNAPMTILRPPCEGHYNFLKISLLVKIC